MHNGFFFFFLQMIEPLSKDKIMGTLKTSKLHREEEGGEVKRAISEPMIYVGL